MTDQIDAWIAGSLKEDQLACTALYNHFAPMIYRLCYSLVLNVCDAEDVVQETFVYVFKNLHRFDPSRAAFKTWLYTIAVSRSRNVHRGRKLTWVDLDSIFHSNLIGPRSEAPEAVIAHQSVQDELVRALNGLPVNLRAAVVLRYGHGLTYREIADVMKCPPKTAESRVRLAHKRLFKLLQPSGQGLLEEILSVSS